MTVSHAKFIFPIKRFSGQSQAVPVCVALVVSLCQPFLPNVSPCAGTGLLLMHFAQLLVFNGFFFFYCDLFLTLFFPFYPWRNTQGPCAFQGVSTQPLKFRTLFFFFNTQHHKWANTCRKDTEGHKTRRYGSCKRKQCEIHSSNICKGNYGHYSSRTICSVRTGIAAAAALSQADPWDYLWVLQPALTR